MGSYLTIVNDTPDTWLCKVGADSKALKWSLIVPFTAGYTAIAGLAQGAFTDGARKAIGAAATKDIEAILTKKHYDLIKPGDSKRYGKMSLSYWRQCECVSIHINDTSAVLDVVMMRPIFSGAKKGSTRKYGIEKWIKKHKLRQIHIGSKEEGEEDAADEKETKDGVKDEEPKDDDK